MTDADRRARGPSASASWAPRSCSPPLPCAERVPVRAGRGLRAALAGTLGLVAACALAGCGGKVLHDGVGGGDPFLGLSAGGGGQGGADATVSSSANAVTSTSSAVSTSTTSVGTTTAVTSTGSGSPPPIPALIELPLGPVELGKPIPFPVHDPTVGFTVVARVAHPADEEVVLGVASLVAPDGVPVLQEFGIEGTLAAFGGYGVAAAAVPQTSAAQAMPEVMPGTWHVTFAAPDDAAAPEVNASVWVRQTVDGAFHGGVLDVNAFIVKGVASQGYVEGALHEAFDGFAGLTLGTVTFHELAEEWAFLDEESFFQVFEQTAGAPGKPALNVLFVAGLTGELEGAAGVSPGAPGYPLEHGTHLSGIVALVYFDTAIDTVILRHEAGHLAGLFHTSEFAPGYGDALGDTSLCDDVPSKLEGCPDYDNIMFPTGGSLLMQLSPQQTQVIRASALYRGIVEAGGAPALPLATGGDVDPGGAWGALADSSMGAHGGGSASDAARAGSHAVRAGNRAAKGSWSAGLSRAAAEHLAGLWCPHGARVDPFAVLRDLGGDDPVQLAAIGTDRSAPHYVRRRALAAAGRAAPPAEVTALLAAIAESPSAPRHVRLGAIEGAAAAGSAGDRAAMASRLAGDSDPLVAALAKRVASR